MTRKDLPFQPWGLKAIAEGKKTLTSRCSGLAAVNKNPDEWVLMDCLCDAFGIVRARFGSLKESSKEVMCECPWRLSRVYPPANVLVTGIIAKRVQDMTEMRPKQRESPLLVVRYPLVATFGLMRSHVSGIPSTAAT